MSRTYPDIYVPDAIAESLAQLPPIPTPPQRPYFQPPPQVIPFRALLPLAPLLILLLISLASQSSAFFLLAFLLFLLGNVVLIGGALITYPQRRKRFLKRVQQYQKKYQHYTQQVEQLHRIEKVSDYQRHLQQIQNTLSTTVPPLPISTNVQKGVSEAHFLAHLNHYFPGRIHTDLGLKIPRYQYPYTPDFCYIQGDLHIDIEIDEPYIYKTQKPYHCYPDPRETKRHTFFLARHWLIIRFAEEQVCRHPKSCCKAIAQLVGQITRTPLDESWSTISDLKPVPRWDEAIAQSMVQRRYRDSYLRVF